MLQLVHASLAAWNNQRSQEEKAQKKSKIVNFIYKYKT